MADQTVDTLTAVAVKLSCDGIDPSQWPELSCTGANQTTLQGSSLLLSADQELSFGGRGEIRAGDDNHRLVLDPPNQALSISESGTIRLLTGSPLRERLSILSNGNVGVNTTVPAFTLDVNGTLNAAEIRQNGTPLAAWEVISGGIGFSGGNVGIDVANPAFPLDVGGAVNATDFLKNGTALVSSQWDAVAGGINFAGGKVGVGTPAPAFPLDVNGPVNAAAFLTNGQPLVGSPWTVSGNNLSYTAGNVGIGTNPIRWPLSVRGIGISEELVSFEDPAGNTKWHINQNLAGNNPGLNFVETGVADGRVFLRAGGNVGIGTVQPAATLHVQGDLRIEGELNFPKTGGGTAALSNRQFDNENAFHPNNVKLIMGSTGIRIIGPGSPPFTYEFAVGHSVTQQIFLPTGGGIRFVTNFFKGFSVNEAGDVNVAGTLTARAFAQQGGQKTGYVVDYFVNGSGGAVEQGDLVVLAGAPLRYWGTGSDVPIPEVDLASEAYDTRVCGIVAHVLTAGELPYVEPAAAETPEVAEEVPDAASFGGPAQAEMDATDLPVAPHPFEALAATSDPAQGRTTVGAEQMGTMVTLGAYAYCKVDADIAPVVAGDLLTTSPTRGHAQKVLDPARATGSIIAKALGGLERGQARIPVLVVHQ